jgi:hypothetical protein
MSSMSGEFGGALSRSRCPRELQSLTPASRPSRRAWLLGALIAGYPDPDTSQRGCGHGDIHFESFSVIGVRNADASTLQHTSPPFKRRGSRDQGRRKARFSATQIPDVMPVDRWE